MNCGRCQQQMIDAYRVILRKPDNKLYRFCTLCRSDNYLSCYKCSGGFATRIIVDGDKEEFSCEHHAIARIGGTPIPAEVPSHVIPAEILGGGGATRQHIDVDIDVIAEGTSISAGKIQPNESVIDSCLDLANYAIFTAMFEHGECDFTDDEDFYKHYEDTLDVLSTIVRDRRAKYGPGNLVIHGPKGTVVRASDKISRLNHFYFSEKK